MTRDLGRDLRVAARRLLATPLFTAFAVLSLAIGIGVTTIAYSLVDSFFFSKLGIRDPDDVAFVVVAGSGRLQFQAAISRPDFDDLRASQTSFSPLAASTSIRPAFTAPTRTEVIRAEAVSGEYFQAVGVGAALGRTILPVDEERSASVVVISHRLWRGHFKSDPAVIGRSVRLAEHAFEIVGVAQPSYEGFLATSGIRGTGAWVPLSIATWFEPASRTPERERRRLLALGRLRAGRSIESAGAEMATIAAALDSAHPRTSAERTSRGRGWTARRVVDVHDDVSEPMRRVGLVAAALVMLVLVVACTNLANLVLARGTTRQHELAVRRALGAARWRLVREQLAESLLIAAVGGLGAYAAMRVLAAILAFDLPMPGSQSLLLHPAVDLSTLLIAGAALLVSLVVFGLEPAIQMTRAADVRGELAATATTVGVPKVRRQKMLLRWQVAVSTAFFILASMTVRYVVSELRHDSGVRMNGLGIAQLNFTMQGWDEARARRALDRVLEETRRQRDIESAAISTGMPFGTYNNPSVQLSTPDRPILPTGTYSSGKMVAATPGIFHTIGVPIVRGRAFDDRDHAGALAVVVLSETAARVLFPASDAVGQQMLMQVRGRVPDRAVQSVLVVGIARDADASYLSPRRGAVVYAPFAQHYEPVSTVVARSSLGSSAAVGALQAAVRTADQNIAIEIAGTASTMLAGAGVFFRFFGIVSLGLGLLTLLLAMVGLYGVQSYGVTQRTREIGVRMSFGATASQIKRMVLKDGYRPVFEGMAIGLFMGVSGRAIIRAYLDAALNVFDPWMFAIVPIPLILAAFCACYLPAHRAAQVDPNVALRTL